MSTGGQYICASPHVAPAVRLKSDTAPGVFPTPAGARPQRTACSRRNPPRESGSRLLARALQLPGVDGIETTRAVARGCRPGGDVPGHTPPPGIRANSRRPTLPDGRPRLREDTADVGVLLHRRFRFAGRRRPRRVADAGFPDQDVAGRRRVVHRRGTACVPCRRRRAQARVSCSRFADLALDVPHLVPGSASFDRERSRTARPSGPAFVSVALASLESLDWRSIARPMATAIEPGLAARNADWTTVAGAGRRIAR